MVINGVGKVGTGLVRHLVEERAHVTVADIRRQAVDRVVTDFGVDAVPWEKAHAADCDVYAPCALGGSLNPTTIPEMRCAAVVGAANNQLADPTCADQLGAAGVLYAPDFVVNAGGVINIAGELGPRGYHRERAYAQVRGIFDTTRAVIATAETKGITTAAAADQLAEERMARLGHVRLIRTFTEGGR